MVVVYLFLLYNKINVADHTMFSCVKIIFKIMCKNYVQVYVQDYV